MLMKQQDRIDDRVKDIEEQLCKLESDKLLVEDKVQQLKEEVRVQYHKMHQLLEDDLGRTLEVLDKAHSKYCQENSTQTLQLNERRQEAKKLLSSVQVVYVVYESQSCTGSVLPPYKVGHLNSKIFLSEVSKKEKNLRKILEGNPGLVLSRLSFHHSSSVFTPADSPNPSSSQQAMLPQYGGRKILMCTMDNCYCSSVPSISNHRGHPPYPRSGSFPWTQDYTHPLPAAPSMSQPLQGLVTFQPLSSHKPHTFTFTALSGQHSQHFVTN
uniref:Tripartite motif containing 8a n=1 Tax=Sinocyclocheilus grahami TaxID=75366 RepID=A0A672QVY2_SINGR